MRSLSTTSKAVAPLTPATLAMSSVNVITSPASPTSGLADLATVITGSTTRRSGAVAVSGAPPPVQVNAALLSSALPAALPAVFRTTARYRTVIVSASPSLTAALVRVPKLSVTLLWFVPSPVSAAASTAAKPRLDVTGPLAVMLTISTRLNPGVTVSTTMALCVVPSGTVSTTWYVTISPIVTSGNAVCGLLVVLIDLAKPGCPSVKSTLFWTR